MLSGQIRPDELADKGKAATRQLAKRQLTWMRGMDNLVLLDSQKVNAETMAQQIAKHIIEALDA